MSADSVTVLHPERAVLEEGFGVGELTARSGLTYQRVDFYSRAGYLRPIDEARPGSGYQRRFTDTECRIARLLKQLLDLGLTVAAAVSVAREHVEAGRPLVVGEDGFLLIGSRVTQ